MKYHFEQNSLFLCPTENEIESIDFDSIFKKAILKQVKFNNIHLIVFDSFSASNVLRLYEYFKCFKVYKINKRIDVYNDKELICTFSVDGTLR